MPCTNALWLSLLLSHLSISFLFPPHAIYSLQFEGLLAMPLLCFFSSPVFFHTMLWCVYIMQCGYVCTLHLQYTVYTLCTSVKLDTFHIQFISLYSGGICSLINALLLEEKKRKTFQYIHMSTQCVLLCRLSHCGFAT